MRTYKLLEANEIGKGVLLENDAGHISPHYELNKKIITETKGFKDSEGVFMLSYRSVGFKTEMVEYTQQTY